MTTVKITITGAAEVIRALERVPDHATTELRKANRELSQLLAGRIKTAALGQGAQAALMAGTVKTFSGLTPGVSAGGSGAVGRYDAPAFKLLYASEFGAVARFGWYAATKYASSTGRQYLPRRTSYWFFKTADEMSPEIVAAWGKAADAVVRQFGEGG